MKSACLWCCVLLLLSRAAAGQAIGIRDGQAPGPRTFQLQYENDAFAHTDYYYSQGIAAMYTHPALKLNPLNAVLPHGDTTVYGLNLEHDAYTPTSILSDSILYGDRPYAASLMVQSFTERQYRRSALRAALTLGVLGPAAGGKEMQTFIHRNTGNDIPHGWQHQIANDVIINYSIAYTCRLVNLASILTIDATAGAEAGTYQCNLNTSIPVKLYVIGGKGTSSFELYIGDWPRLNLVGYDATLQGGFFNRSSPYTLPASAITRVNFSNKLALFIGYRSVLLSASYTMLTKQFNTGKSHAWGGITAGIHF